MIPTLKTERLILSPRRQTDLEDCVAMDSDIEVRRYIDPDFRDNFVLEDYRSELRERIDRDFGEGCGYWILRDAGDRFLGQLLLIPMAETGPEIEVGWRLPRVFWGQGFAGEAARAVLNYAFTTLGLDQVVARIDPENRPSAALAERLGFLCDGRHVAAKCEYDLYRLKSAK